MPFADELDSVEVVAAHESWLAEFALLAAQIRQAGVPNVVSIDHVGSTAVPGLAAKDVIDVQVRVSEIDDDSVLDRLSAVGFRLRPEDWNRIEMTRSGPEAKLVFAAATGARRSNVHIRVAGSRGAYDTLLFREFLRDDRLARETWSEFKQSIIRTAGEIDLIVYGQVKQPAWAVLMLAADRWARDRDWRPDPPSAPDSV